MCRVEDSVKRQFARVFRASDWHIFKSMADCYLRRAGFLRKRDLDVRHSLKLLVRNSQKRLFIGVGVELLLKAIYLKNGYAINKPKTGNKTGNFPFKLGAVDSSQLREDQTFLLGVLIDQINKVIVLEEREAALRGLRIAQVFRNKEGHVVTPQHAFDDSNYRDVESALRELYRTAFGEILEVRFSLAPNEKPLWRVCPTSSATHQAR